MLIICMLLVMCLLLTVNLRVAVVFTQGVFVTVVYSNDLHSFTLPVVS